MTMLVIRLVFSLLFIAVVLVVAMKWVAKKQAGAATGALEVLARQPLTRTTSVAVVRVGDRAFVLGAGESQVTLIGETDLGSLADLGALSPSATSAGTGSARPVAPTGPSPVAGSLLDGAVWKSALNGLRQMTVRR